MSRREDRTQRRVKVVRHNRPPTNGRFARRPGPRPEGWRARLPGALQRPLAWQAPVAGRAVAGAGKAAASATRSLRDRLRRGLPQTLAGRVLVAVAAIAVFTGATWTTTRSPLLDVDHIQVSGGALVTVDQAITGAGLRRGEPMVSVDTAAAEGRLERLPWVNTALVERAFPNTVRIRLTERAAAASAARPGGGWVLLDRGGRVLADRPDRPGDLPEVTGAGATPPPGSAMDSARPALDVVAALPEAVRRQVTAVVLDGDAVTLHTGVRQIRMGPPTSLPAKVAALTVLLDRVGSRSVAILDLRVPTAPVVVPTAPTPATSIPAPGRGATAPVNPGKPRD
ncbi:MAG: cell division protein FtsQ [Actinomycetota bacterium]|nr:cell division protein FtsQ [Actinomycetota bacterium]